jgi:hypothetical protein
MLKKKALNDLNKELDNTKKLTTAAEITTALKNADTKINELQTAQKAFTQAYEAEKTRIETAKQEEAKKKDKAIEKVDAEITKITNALNGLATATNALTDNSIINVQSVKDAKAELDAKKKALNDLNKELDNTKKLTTAAEITTALKNADTKINELQTAQNDFIQAYKLQEKASKEAFAKYQRINKGITAIQNQTKYDSNKNDLTNAIIGISNSSTNLDKYKSFFKNIKNSTSDQKATLLNKLDNSLQKPLDKPFSDDQKKLAKNIVENFNSALKNDYDKNTIYKELSALNEYKTLSEEDRKKMAEDISQELYKENKDFFVKAFKKVLNSGINDIFPQNLDANFYNALKTDLASDVQGYITNHANNDDIHNIMNMIETADDYESNFNYRLVNSIMNHNRYNYIMTNVSLDNSTRDNEITKLNNLLAVNNGRSIFDKYSDALKTETDANKIDNIKNMLKLLLSNGPSKDSKFIFNNLITENNIVLLFDKLGDDSVIKEYLAKNNSNNNSDIFEKIDDPKIVKNLVEALKYVGDIYNKRYFEDKKIDIATNIIRTKIDNLIANYKDENKQDTKQALKILFKSIDKLVEDSNDLLRAKKFTIAELLGEVLTTNADRTEIYKFLDDLYENNKSGRTDNNPYYFSIRLFLDAMIEMFNKRASSKKLVLDNHDKELLKHIIQSEDSKQKAESLIMKAFYKNNMGELKTYIEDLKNFKY